MVILWHRGCVPKYSNLNLNLNFKFKFEPLIVAEGSRAFGHTLLSGVFVVSRVIGINGGQTDLFSHHHMSNIYLFLIFDDWKNSAAKNFSRAEKLAFLAWKSQAQNSKITWG
jgi:hypothetical protein